MKKSKQNKPPGSPPHNPSGNAHPVNNKGLRRVWNAFFHSISGFKACYRTEEAFQQELWLSAVLIPLGLYLGDNAPERLWLCASVMFVLLVELLNTAIERAIDRISFEKHELSKESKDMGSAAVLLSILIAIFTWIVILMPDQPGQPFEISF